MPKRPVEIVVLSDIHLGTYGCHSKELLRYLKSIDPKMIILNGDVCTNANVRRPRPHLIISSIFLKYSLTVSIQTLMTLILHRPLP